MGGDAKNVAWVVNVSENSFLLLFKILIIGVDWSSGTAMAYQNWKLSK